MEKRALLYSGKAKDVYATDDPNLCIVHFRDSATAFNALKKSEIAGKGELNNLISAHFFDLLASHGVETHFVGSLGPREMLVRRLEIIKVEVVVRNITAGSLAKRLGLPEGLPVTPPVLEYYYKDDTLGDPLVNDSHILSFGWASAAELSTIAAAARQVNDILLPALRKLDLLLVDFKLEFGRHAGRVMLGDEISPDTCRFWDAQTREKLDKDRFRRDLGGVAEAYQEIYRRLKGGTPNV
ncbi:MAG: Phosphoribosylaminoimidazole-succinocarboxamide synthase [Firmicutes bacterium]|nr:Phosphoribosylaminoimidazole-succinocarboxamide synthase [candidate division NPL-UPA2 bacterium]